MSLGNAKYVLGEHSVTSRTTLSLLKVSIVSVTAYQFLDTVTSVATHAYCQQCHIIYPLLPIHCQDIGAEAG